MLCELLEDKICIFYAEYILRNGKKFNHREFMTNWQQAVPVGMVTSPEHLKVLFDMINLAALVDILMQSVCLDPLMLHGYTFCVYLVIHVHVCSPHRA